MRTVTNEDGTVSTEEEKFVYSLSLVCIQCFVNYVYAQICELIFKVNYEVCV